jgi:hypothetical protein
MLLRGTHPTRTTFWPSRRTSPSFLHMFFVILNRCLPNTRNHTGAGPVNAPLIVLSKRRPPRLLSVLLLNILLLHSFSQYANRATRDFCAFSQEPHARTTVSSSYTNCLVPRLAMDAATPPQSPSHQNIGSYFPPDLKLTGEQQLRLILPLTGHQLMEIWPAPAPFVPYFPSSSYFRTQERAFFSRSNAYFRIDADIPEATGGQVPRERGNTQTDSRHIPTASRHPPSSQQSSLSSGNVSCPSQCQPLVDCRELYSPPPTSRRSRRLQTTLINPLPVTAGTSNGRQVAPYQAAVFHPYLRMQPETTQDPSTTADEEGWRHPIPISERRRAGKAPRRRHN